MTGPMNTPLGKRGGIVNWVVADNTARDALRYRWLGRPITANDIGCICRVGVGPYAYYELVGVGPLAWSAIGTGVSFGTMAGTACEGNDGRLSNARQLAAGADKTKLTALPDAATLATSLAAKADAAATTSALAEKASVAVNTGFLSIRTITASDLFVSGDLGGLVDVNAAGANTLTLNNGIGAPKEVITAIFRGAGLGAIAQGANVQIITPTGLSLTTLGQGSWVQLVKLVTATTDIWAISGHLKEA